MSLMREKRLELGLTAARLAELSGSQEMRVYFLERGRYLPKVPEAIRLGAVLGIEPLKLFPRLAAKIAAEVKS